MGVAIASVPFLLSRNVRGLVQCFEQIKQTPSAELAQEVALARAPVVLMPGQSEDNKVVETKEVTAAKQDVLAVEDFCKRVAAYQRSAKPYALLPSDLPKPLMLSAPFARSVDELVEDLRGLRKMLFEDGHPATRITNPIAFTLVNGGHAILVSYDPTEENWYIVDANNNVKKAKKNSEQALAREIAVDLSAKDFMFFAMDIFSLKQDRALLMKRFNNFLNEKEFNKRQRVTPEKARAVDRNGDSWLHVAAREATSVKLISALITAKADIEKKNRAGRLPLDVANEKTRGELESAWIKLQKNNLALIDMKARLSDIRKSYNPSNQKRRKALKDIDDAIRAIEKKEKQESFAERDPEVLIKELRDAMNEILDTMRKDHFQNGAFYRFFGLTSSRLVRKINEALDPPPERPRGWFSCCK